MAAEGFDHGRPYSAGSLIEVRWSVCPRDTKNRANGAASSCASRVRRKPLRWLPHLHRPRSPACTGARRPSSCRFTLPGRLRPKHRPSASPPHAAVARSMSLLLTRLLRRFSRGPGGLRRHPAELTATTGVASALSVGPSPLSCSSSC